MTRLGPRGIPHFVYRVYDAADVLLYVGCTARPEGRWRNHLSSSPWARFAARIEWQVGGNFHDARVIEAHAIRDEQPFHNRRRYTSARSLRDLEKRAAIHGVREWCIEENRLRNAAVGQ